VNVACAVRIEQSDEPERLSGLKGEWSELFEAGGGLNPFLSWEWQHTFARAFVRRRPLWILEARDAGNRLVGLLVLCARSLTGSKRHWCLLGNGVGGADGLDIQVRPGFGPPVRDAMAQAIASSLPDWDLLELEDLPCGSRTIVALRRAMRPRGVRDELGRRFACPGFALRGTFAEHLMRFRRRETYQRRRRWLERQPGYCVAVARRPAEASEAMADFLRLHHLRWDAEGGSLGIPRGLVEDFHRELAPLFAARGWLRLYRMFVGGQCIASVYGFELGGRFFYYQSGMDPAWRARSPGLVLIGQTVEDAYAHGLADYDFLRGEEPHKLDWSCDRRETCSMRLRAPGLRSEADAAAERVFRMAREAAKAVAPDGLWRRLQRARQSVTVAGFPSLGAGARGGEARSERGQAAG